MSGGRDRLGGPDESRRESLPGRSSIARSERAPVGVLMLDADFERFPGDIGNRTTWDFPVLYEVLPGVTAAQATTNADDALLAPLLAGARRLVARGAAAVTTSCGFLALYQDELAARLDVPVATSALIQVPWLYTMGLRRVGVLTFDARSLGPPQLVAVGAPPDVPIVGLSHGGAFRREILGGPPAGLADREADAVLAAEDLMCRFPDCQAIVLECTNLAPHASAIAVATGRPVYDIVTLINWLAAGLAPRRWR
jgi:hypothetical protein